MNFDSRHLAVLSAAFHGLRLMPGAVHVMFLVERGVAVKELALLQMFFSVTSLCIAYPEGVLITRYGAKVFTIIASLCIAIYNGLCLFAPHAKTLIVAHICYAVGLSIMTIAIPIWCASLAFSENHYQLNYIVYLGHLENECQALWSVFSACIGTVLPIIFNSSGYVILYLMTTIIMFFFSFLFFFGNFLI